MYMLIDFDFFKFHNKKVKDLFILTYVQEINAHRSTIFSISNSNRILRYLIKGKLEYCAKLYFICCELTYKYYTSIF